MSDAFGDLLYKLDENLNPVKLAPGERADMAAEMRLLKRTDLKEHGWVSTVFLALDHSHGQPGPPILFETMVFGGPLDSKQRRYAYWAEAIEGHDAMVRTLLEPTTLKLK